MNEITVFENLNFFSLFTLPRERLSESFIQNKIFNLVDLSSDTQHLIGTIFGFFSLINAVHNTEITFQQDSHVPF